MKSASGSEARLSLTPARVRAGRSRGMVTSIGSHGGKSRLSIHAAVFPENAARSGKRLWTARSVSSTSCCRPVQEYWPRLIRRHAGVWRPCHLRPASRASATVNGSTLSSFGIGDDITPKHSLNASSGTTHLVKTVSVPDSRDYPRWWGPESIVSRDYPWCWSPEPIVSRDYPWCWSPEPIVSRDYPRVVTRV